MFESGLIPVFSKIAQIYKNNDNGKKIKELNSREICYLTEIQDLRYIDN